MGMLGLASVLLLTATGCSAQTDRAPGPVRAPASAPVRPAQSVAPGWSTRMIVLSAAVKHVHALVTDTGGAVLAATHAGLYRVAADGSTERVGATRHDLMGLVRGPDGTLLASGHPQAGSALADPLGVIASGDGGLTWRARALQGQADFHSLTQHGTRMAGLSSQMLMTSTDQGRSWTARGPSPAWTLSLDSRSLWAAGEQGLLRSDDDGSTFTPTVGAPRLGLATAANDTTPWGVDLDGGVWVRTGGRWQRVDTVGTAEAIAAVDARTAYIAQASSTLLVLSSTGRS